MPKPNRIELHDSLLDSVMRLSEGNPGAVRVCADLVKHAPATDPANIFGGIGGLVMLDAFGIYGSRIWLLFKDVCREDLTRMLGMLRAVQLGILDQDALDRMIDGNRQRPPLSDVDAIVDQVRQRLPEFGQVAAAAA